MLDYFHNTESVQKNKLVIVETNESTRSAQMVCKQSNVLLIRRNLTITSHKI